MGSYSAKNYIKDIRNDLLPICQLDKSINMPVNDMVASLVLFLISQISRLSSKKYIIFHSINPIPDFAIGFASPEKEKDNTLTKWNN